MIEVVKYTLWKDVSMLKLFLILGSINAALSVALGAFGAHGLEGKVSERLLEVWKTGVSYQMFHSIGIIVVAFAIDKWQGLPMLDWAGWAMFIGIVLFSGSLYTMTLTGITKLGMITPFGGLAFIVGWIFLIISVYRAV